MEQFGKYALVKLVATGGMAEVFLAKEFGISGFQRILAIKRILPALAQDQEFLEMFTEEARLSAQLSHQNIVQVYDFGLVEHSYFIAMEFIDGLTLFDALKNDFLQDQHLPIELALFILCELCQGLTYAHQKNGYSGEPLNIIHRDISPKNVMLSYDGAVKLMDFGIAKAADQQRQETVVGTIKGKLSYLSPEQVAGEKLDQRSDIFSLGIVFYELLTSRQCFEGDNEFAILYKIRSADITPASELNPQVDDELETLLSRILHPEREQRFQSAEELLTALNAYRYSKSLVAGANQLSEFLKQRRDPAELDTLSLLKSVNWDQVGQVFSVLAGEQPTAPKIDLSGEESTAPHIPLENQAPQDSRSAAITETKSQSSILKQETAFGGLQDSPADYDEYDDEYEDEYEHDPLPLRLLLLSLILLLISVTALVYIGGPRLAQRLGLVPVQPRQIERPVIPQAPESNSSPASSLPGSTQAVPIPSVQAPSVENEPASNVEKTSVRFTSVLPIQLLQDGKKLGAFSGNGLEVSLLPGTYSFEAVGFSRKEPYFYRSLFSQEFLAEQNQEVQVPFPASGTLHVTANPPAVLYIDGQRLDFTPFPRLKISAGWHALRFEFANGKSLRSRIEIRPGRLESLHATPPS